MSQAKARRPARPAARDRSLSRFLASAVETGAVRAAAVVVGDAARLRRWACAGASRGSPRRAVTAGSRFDLASVTKPFIATLALRLDSLGLLPLRTRVGEIWPEAAAGIGRKPLQALLRHRSGLVPWAPLYRLCAEPSQAAGLLVSGELGGARSETYSDLGYILWGLAAEQALAAPLSRILLTHLLEPAGLAAIAPPLGPRAGAVVCGLDTRREVELAAAMGHKIDTLPSPHLGRVQDGNARFFGGLAGHAGLFASAEEVWRLARIWLRPGELLPRRALEAALAGGRRFALGWFRRRLRDGGGPALSEDSIGHPGFTGCSVWIDRDAAKIAVLLTHRTAVTVDLNPWRRRFHALALEF